MEQKVRTISNREIFSIARDTLLEGSTVRITVNGESMLPFFRSGSTITLRPVREEDIRMQVRHYPYKEALACPTDDETLTRVWRLCADTMKYATQEVYMDCPTREKGQYLGDGTVSSAAHTLITGDGAMMKKALYEYARSTFITDGIMTVAPCSYMQEIADYSLQYPHQLLWYYRHTSLVQRHSGTTTLTLGKGYATLKLLKRGIAIINGCQPTLKLLGL